MMAATTKPSSSSISSPFRPTSSDTSNICTWDSLLPRYYEFELESSPGSPSTFRTDSPTTSPSGRDELDNDYNDAAYERVLLDAEFKNWLEEDSQNENEVLLESLTKNKKELLVMPLNSAVRRLAIFAGHLEGKGKEAYTDMSRKNTILYECPEHC